MNRRNLIKSIIGGAAVLAVPASGRAKETDVEIIKVGGIHSDSVSVLIRNNSKKAVGCTDIVGVARLNGKLVGAVSAAQVAPYRLEPDAVGIARVYFGGDDLDPATEFEFEVEYEEPESDSHQDLVVTEVSPTSEALVGFAENQSGVDVFGPIKAIGVSLDADGEITGYYFGYAQKDEVEPDESTAFEATFYGDEQTDDYMVAVVGWLY